MMWLCAIAVAGQIRRLGNNMNDPTDNRVWPHHERFQGLPGRILIGLVSSSWLRWKKTVQARNSTRKMHFWVDVTCCQEHPDGLKKSGHYRHHAWNMTTEMPARTHRADTGLRDLEHDTSNLARPIDIASIWFRLKLEQLSASSSHIMSKIWSMIAGCHCENVLSMNLTGQVSWLHRMSRIGHEQNTQTDATPPKHDSCHSTKATDIKNSE